MPNWKLDSFPIFDGEDLNSNFFEFWFPLAYSPGTWVALHTTMPTRTSLGVEVSGNGYGRAYVHVDQFGSAPSGSTGTYTTRIIESNGPLGTPWSFPTPTGSWGSVVGCSLWTAQTGGRMLCYFQFNSPITPGTGDTVRVAPYYFGGQESMSIGSGCTVPFNSFNGTYRSIYTPHLRDFLEDFFADGAELGLTTTGKVEISGSDYQRQSVSLVSVTGDSPVVVEFSGPVTFNCTGGSWPTIEAVGLFKSGGGLIIGHTVETLDSGPVNIGDGGSFTVNDFRFGIF